MVRRALGSQSCLARAEAQISFQDWPAVRTTWGAAQNSLDAKGRAPPPPTAATELSAAAPTSRPVTCYLLRGRPVWPRRAARLMTRIGRARAIKRPRSSASARLFSVLNTQSGRFVSGQAKVVSLHLLRHTREQPGQGSERTGKDKLAPADLRRRQRDTDRLSNLAKFLSSLDSITTEFDR